MSRNMEIIVYISSNAPKHILSGDDTECVEEAIRGWQENYQESSGGWTEAEDEYPVVDGCAVHVLVFALGTDNTLESLKRYCRCISHYLGVSTRE